MILATCATIAAILASAQGGETIRLEGECPRISLSKKQFSPRITIEAQGAVVHGLQLLNGAGGIIWRGGTITAPEGGTFKTGPAGYGVQGSGAKNLMLDGVTIKEALKGLVWSVGSSNLNVSNSVFEKIAGDAINLASSNRIVIFNNKIRDFYPNGDYHQDGVQMWNGASDVVVQGNEITGIMEGIVDFGTTGQAPVERVRVVNNRIRISTYHGITLWNARDSLIANNDVGGTEPSKITQIHFHEGVTACDNLVWDYPKSQAILPCR